MIYNDDEDDTAFMPAPKGSFGGNVRRLVNSVTEVSWHRNGISGKGFYAVLFTGEVANVSAEEAAFLNVEAGAAIPNAKWYAAITDEPGECYVVCLDLIQTRGVRFGANSWRGDQYEAELRPAIEKMQSSGSIRVGPFGVPV